MTLAQTIRKSYAGLKRGWARAAERAFSSAVPSDDRASGEFISAFISEQDLSFPRPGDRRPGNGH